MTDYFGKNKVLVFFKVGRESFSWSLGCIVVSVCSLCNAAQELSSHIFFSFSVVKKKILVQFLPQLIIWKVWYSRVKLKIKIFWKKKLQILCIFLNVIIIFNLCTSYIPSVTTFYCIFGWLTSNLYLKNFHLNKICWTFYLHVVYST